MQPDPALPSTVDVLAQLKPLSRLESASVVLLPLALVGLYFVFAHLGLWPLALGCTVYLSFATYGSCCHDLVHANCGLSRRSSHLWLSFIELLMLRSGTVYRSVHLNHHRLYPDFEADPEGRASYFSLVRTLLEGPIFQLRLGLWALRTTRGLERGRVILELSLALGFLGLGVALWRAWPPLLIYQALVVMGSWIIPLITSYLVHTPHGEGPLEQTRLYRGRFFRLVALDHLYHLEHHLHPMVPHQRWPDLARLLNPALERAGVAVVSWPVEQHPPLRLGLKATRGPHRALRSWPSQGSR